VNTPHADPSLQRPIKRLEGFQKVFLSAGQTKTVSLPMKIADLAFYNEADKRFEVDQGQYGIQISTSSADSDIQAQDTINVDGKLTQRPSVLSAQPRISGADAPRGISQRVMFPEGVVIDPGLTLAMNDDSLYGWIAPGQSKPLPPGTRLSFSSDRPGVVSVSPNGVIRTVSNGAATVTATATYHGASASTSFVVRVVSDLSDLKVGGISFPRSSTTTQPFRPAPRTRRGSPPARAPARCRSRKRRGFRAWQPSPRPGPTGSSRPTR
jgi:beta-glucosidase